MTTTDTPPSPTDAKRRRKRLLIIGGSVVGVLVLAFVAFAIWFLRDDAPDEVSIDAAAAQIADDGSGAEGIDGTWTVDTSIGEFSFEDSTGTFVGFRVAEELTGIGSTEAVGRTPVVSGTLEASGTVIEDVDITADLSQLTTDDSRRDGAARRALGTDEFPEATFRLTAPIEVPEAALAGESFSVDAAGDLTIRDVTTPVTFPLEARLVGDTIVVVGSLDVEFATYGVSVPSAPVVVSAEDHGPIELQLFFRR